MPGSATVAWINNSGGGGGGGTSGNVTWNNTVNAAVSSPNITQSGAGYMKANSDQAISPTAGHATKFEWKYSLVSGDVLLIFLGPSAGAPYSFTGTSTQMTVRVSNFGEQKVDAYEWNGSGMSTFRAEQVGSSADTFGVGFDGSGHIQLLFNGSAVWTSTATYSGDHVMYVTIQDDVGGGDGLLNVTYQQ